MSSPHKHSEVIKAWADGITVQERVMRCGEWQEWKDVVSHAPTFWTDSCYQFRIKPKPDMVVYSLFNTPRESHCDVIMFNNGNKFTTYLNDENQIKLTFDGETRKLKSVEIVK